MLIEVLQPNMAKNVLGLLRFVGVAENKNCETWISSYSIYRVCQVKIKRRLLGRTKGINNKNIRQQFPCIKKRRYLKMSVIYEF